MMVIPLQYEVYLRPELRKLADLEVAESYLEKAQVLIELRPEFRMASRLADVGLPLDPARLAELTRSGESVEAFLRGVSPAQAVDLTALCSLVRCNDVRHRLAEAGCWRTRSVAAMSLRIQQAEPDPQYARIWQDHGGSLREIACDERLHQLSPYSEPLGDRPVEYPVVLARRDQGLKVFDGIHRAIKLVRLGKEYLDVCAPDC